MKNRVLFILVLLLLVVTGCDNKVHLKGKVVFSDDGSPVPKGTVFFETDSYSARGNLKPDGTFVVGSEKQSDGLPPGMYRVHISGAQKSIGSDERNHMEIYESLIDEKFANRSTSGITIDVIPSTKFFEIKVDRFDPTKARKVAIPMSAGPGIGPPPPPSPPQVKK